MNATQMILNFDIESYFKEKYSNISKSDLTAFGITLFLGFCIHGAALVNFIINEDFQLSGYIDLMISGRFLYGPIYNITDSYPLQFLHTFIFITLTSLSGIITAKLLSAKSTALKSIVAVIFLSYPAFAVGLTYNNAILVYAVSCLAAVSSVYYAQKNGKINFFISALLLALSLGIYQTYLCVSAAICCAILINYISGNDLTDKENLKVFACKVLRFAAYGISAGIIYVLLVKVLSALNGTSLAGYQGADKMGSLDLSALPFRKIYACYSSIFNNTLFKFQYLFKPALLIILGAAGFSIVYKQFSSRPTAKATINTIAILILIVAMVIMAILIPFIAPYADVTYMQTYGVVVILCSALVIASELSVFSKNTMFILGLVIIVCFTTRTNAQYYRAQLITEASIHTVNRVFSRIEQAEGFSCDKKLAIIGTLPNKYLKTETVPPFSNEGNSGYSGNFVGLSRANQSHKFTRILSYLGYKITPAIEKEEILAASQIALNMPTYPQKGSIVATNDMIVVKMNDPLLVIYPTQLGDGKYKFEFTPFSQNGNLEIVWQVILQGTQGQIFQTPTPELSITLDKPGQTYCVVAHYRSRGAQEFIHSKPHWFIAN